MAKELTYEEQLKDERWLYKRQIILDRDFHICQHCMTGKNLHVHHRYYEDGLMAWDYPDEALITLCKDCHEAEHQRVGPHPKDELLKLGIKLRSMVGALRGRFKSHG